MYKDKRANDAENKQGQATDGCTFKPEILKKQMQNTTKGDLDGTVSGGSKWEELYQQAHAKRAKDRQDKDHDEILLEQNATEFTFQPNAHKYQNGAKPQPSGNYANLLERQQFSPRTNRSNKLEETQTKQQVAQQRISSQPPAPIRGAVKQQTHSETTSSTVKQQQFKTTTTTSTHVVRQTQQQMHFEQEQHEEEDVYQQAEGDYYENNSQEADDHEEGEEPLLYVDVNLGQAKTRIALYSRSNPQRVAERFVQEHGLDVNILDNLTNLLTEQLATALQGVEEEEGN